MNKHGQEVRQFQLNKLRQGYWTYSVPFPYTSVGKGKNKGFYLDFNPVTKQINPAVKTLKEGLIKFGNDELKTKADFARYVNASGSKLDGILSIARIYFYAGYIFVPEENTLVKSVENKQPLLTLEEAKRIIKKLNNYKKVFKTIKGKSPFSKYDIYYKFFGTKIRTIDGYLLSSSFTGKAKKYYRQKHSITPEDVKNTHINFKIAAQSKIYNVRKRNNLKVSFSLKRLEEEIIIPVLLKNGYNIKRYKELNILERKQVVDNLLNSLLFGENNVRVILKNGQEYIFNI